MIAELRAIKSIRKTKKELQTHPLLITKFLTLKQTPTHDIDAVSMAYHLTFDQNGNPSFSSRRNRLVKREKQFRWHGFVHEYLEVGGSILHSDIAIIHQKERIHSDRNLRIYENALKAGKLFFPRDQYYYANECKDHGVYEKAIEWYQKFLNGKKRGLKITLKLAVEWQTVISI
ncbi:hypothetical protein [Priestia megaterium]|uniref:hypothetical protein n=1 Tax=Priestia megaterium TaxID=1404 RepID=UPI0039FCDABA